MKKFIKSFAIILMTTLMGFTVIPPAFAQENSNEIIITQNAIDNIDKYVDVENNQYVLNLPYNITIDEELKQVVLNKMNAVNTYISKESLRINNITKIATQTIFSRKYGVNSISFSWNSIIFNMDAGLVQLLLKAGLAGAAVALAAAFPPLAVFIVANPVLGLASVAIAVSVVDSLIGSGIKNGVEIHYNFSLRQVTVVRPQ